MTLELFCLTASRELRLEQSTLNSRGNLFTQGSRRDQEEGGGTGPSSFPRGDNEQGGGAGLQKLDFFRFGLFLNSSATDIVLLTAQHGV